MASKYYWTTDGLEKIKASKIQSMRIGKKVRQPTSEEVLDEIASLEYMVFPVINNKWYDKPIADGMESPEEAKAWVNQNFK